MPNDENESGPQDRTSINMNDGFEVRYWSKELGISQQQLKAIVGKAGTMLKDIRVELATLGPRAWRS